MLSRNGVFVVVLSVLSLVSDGASQPVEEGPELVLLGGNIVTLDDRHGTVEALAAKDGRILAVGTTEDIRRLIGADTRVIDLEGLTAVPGFIEGHGHFTGIGDALQILDLMHVANWDEVIAMVAEAAKAAKPGEWILGRGWHQDKWDRAPEGAIEGFPTHASLSAVSPNNPVGLTHASGHASFFNAKAMRLAGVDATTADPPGGAGNGGSERRERVLTGALDRGDRRHHTGDNK